VIDHCAAARAERQAVAVHALGFLDPDRLAALGARAEEAVRRRCGVVGRCAEEMLEALNGGRTS
jgi:hypothetical protein